MSLTFRPTLADGRPLLRCACDALHEVNPLGHRGNRDLTCPACQASLNVHEGTGADLRAYLGLSDRPYGTIGASALAELCRRRLAMVDTEIAIPATQVGRVFTGGRDADRLRIHTENLLVIATLAGPQCVSWE